MADHADAVEQRGGARGPSGPKKKAPDEDRPGLKGREG